MFEQIHNSKERIFFYERVKNHKAKARISRLRHIITYNTELRLSGNHTMTEYEWAATHTRLRADDSK